MGSDPGSSIETLRSKLKAGERGGSDRDREQLLAFSDRLRLLRTEYTDHRHEKLLRHCVRMSEHANAALADALTDREAAETVVAWINAEYDNEETNRDYRSALRVFGKRVTDGDDLPDTLDWVPTGTSRSYDPAPDPGEMLTWEDDVKPMIDHAHSSRDAALVAVAFDSGARSGELQTLRVGDVSDAAHGLRIQVDGRRGERSVLLIPSGPYLREWLADHPRSTDPDAPLWCRLEDGEDLSYRSFRDIFETLATRAGVDKPTTPTNFRRSNTAWLARKGANEALIQDRQGRERGSEHVARYLARFGSEWDDQYAAMHGREIDTDESVDELAPIECPRCGEDTPHDEPLCVWCGQALDLEAADAADRAKDTLRDAMVRADDPETRAALAEAARSVETDPDLAGEIIETVARHQDSSS